MKKIKCPKCKHEVEILLSNAVDELGEVYRCSNCGYEFRFTNN